MYIMMQVSNTQIAKIGLQNSIFTLSLAVSWNMDLPIGP